MNPPHEQSDPGALTPWLVRIPEIFAGLAPVILRELGAVTDTPLGQEYHLIKTARPEQIHESEVGKFLRWNLPMEHTWPCHPRKMDKFIEKAAQTLLAKFGQRHPQGIFMGQLNPGSPDPYYKSLASNLRGRTLLLFPTLEAGGVEEQDPSRDSLFCLVGREGLFCGMQSPRACNGFYPGGSKYISVDNPGTISRAGAKLAEALHYLKLHRNSLPTGSHWLELGACPGGMTSELLARDYHVTAIDRAPLDPRVAQQNGLVFVNADVSTFVPLGSVTYEAMLCDMNGPPEDSIDQVIRLSRWLKRPGLVVFTLKLPRIETLAEPCERFRRIVNRAAKGGLGLLAQTHLTYNRHEFTLFFERS